MKKREKDDAATASIQLKLISSIIFLLGKNPSSVNYLRNIVQSFLGSESLLSKMNTVQQRERNILELHKKKKLHKHKERLVYMIESTALVK